MTARGPRPASLVRLAGTVCALVACGGLAFALGWWPLGVVLCVVALLVVAACVALGEAVVRVALRAHANVFATVAGAHGGPKAPAASGEAPEERAARKAVDARVGFLLGAGESPMDAALPEAERAAMLSARRAEREATYAWLESCEPARRVELTASDGVTLVAREHACAPGSGRWVILAHGYGGHGTEMMLYARRWAHMGFNLLVCDMRGHGESGGRFVGMGWLDRLDLVSWARWIVSEHGQDVRIALHGHSMGGAAVCQAAGEQGLPPQVRCVVADCALARAWDGLAGAAELAGVPEHPMLDLASLVFACHRGGYRLTCADATRAVAHARVPMLFVHGTRDALVPPQASRDLRAACADADAELLLVEGAGHCESCLAHPDGYWAAVGRLLRRAGVL